MKANVEKIYGRTNTPLERKQLAIKGTTDGIVLSIAQFIKDTISRDYQILAL